MQMKMASKMMEVVSIEFSTRGSTMVARPQMTCFSGRRARSCRCCGLRGAMTSAQRVRPNSHQSDKWLGTSTKIQPSPLHKSSWSYDEEIQNRHTSALVMRRGWVPIHARTQSTATRTSEINKMHVSQTVLSSSSRAPNRCKGMALWCRVARIANRNKSRGNLYRLDFPRVNCTADVWCFLTVSSHFVTFPDAEWCKPCSLNSPSLSQHSHLPSWHPGTCRLRKCADETAEPLKSVYTLIAHWQVTAAPTTVLEMSPAPLNELPPLKINTWLPAAC